MVSGFHQTPSYLVWTRKVTGYSLTCLLVSFVMVCLIFYGRNEIDYFIIMNRIVNVISSI